ncbi:MAG TPA: phosphoglycolate phosphatase [Xanthomonadaceae bacterium]|nr:phosphoglycolate phosphatase [Xanthomonadaceae bacterium]
MNPRYPLVIFDLDGTLVDSVSDIAEALNLTLRQWRLPQVDEATVRGWVGEGVRVLTATALRELGAAVTVDAVMPDMMRHYGQCLLHAPRVYPGAREALQGLRDQGATLAVCTNKPVRFVEPLLRHLDLASCFSAWLGGDSLPERKPAARPLLHLAGQFGYAPAQCLMVGDSATDAAAAHAAAMPLAMVRYGYLRGFDPEAAGAVAVVDDLRELLAL